MRLINRILQAAVAVSAAVLLFKINLDFANWYFFGDFWEQCRHFVSHHPVWTFLIGYASLYPPSIAYLGWYGFVEFLKRGTIGRSRK